MVSKVDGEKELLNRQPVIVEVLAEWDGCFPQMEFSLCMETRLLCQHWNHIQLLFNDHKNSLLIEATGDTQSSEVTHVWEDLHIKYIT